MPRIKKDYSQYIDYIKKHNSIQGKVDLWQKYNLEQKRKGQKGISKQVGLDLINEVRGVQKKEYKKRTDKNKRSEKVIIEKSLDYSKDNSMTSGMNGFAWKNYLKQMLRENYGYIDEFNYVVKVFFTASFDLRSQHTRFAVFIPQKKNFKTISLETVKKGLKQFFQNTFRNITKKYAQNFAGQDIPFREIEKAIGRSHSMESLYDNLMEQGIEIYSIEKEVLPQPKKERKKLR